MDSGCHASLSNEKASQSVSAGPANTPHQKDRPPKIVAGDDCAQSAAPSHIHRSLSRRRPCAWKRCTNNRDDGSLEKVPSEEWAQAGVRLASKFPHLPTPEHPDIEEEDKAAKPAMQSGRLLSEQLPSPCHRWTVSRPRCTDAAIQTGGLRSETAAVLSFQHSLQKAQVVSESHGCRNAEVMHSFILIFTLMAVNVLISESLVLKRI